MLVDDYGKRVQFREAPPPPPPPPPGFDAKTEQQVRRVQRENGLPETGRLDKDTCQALQARSPGFSAPRLGERLETHGYLGPGDEGEAAQELHGLLDAYARAEPPQAGPTRPQPEPQPGHSARPEEKSLWDRFRDKAQEVGEGIAEKGKEAVEKGKEIVEKAVDGVKDLAGMADKAIHFEEDVVNGLNSEGDKAFFKLGYNVEAGVSGEGLGKLGKLDKAAGKAPEPPVKTPGAGRDAVADIMESARLTAKVGESFTGEVALARNPQSGAPEYQVTIQRAAELSGSLNLPVLPKGIKDSLGSVDVSFDESKSVNMGSTYTFANKEDAIRGMRLLEKQEMSKGLLPSGEERSWLADRHSASTFDFALKDGGGLAAGKDGKLKLPGAGSSGIPGPSVDIGGAVESGYKADGTLKVTVKNQPGKPTELTAEIKAAARKDIGTKVEIDAGVKAQAKTEAKDWENEVSLQMKYDLAEGDDPIDFLRGDKRPKSIEIKGSRTDWGNPASGNGAVLRTDRPDSGKVEYSKLYQDGEGVDWKRESRFLAAILGGGGHPRADFESHGYKVVEKRIDSSGLQAKAKLEIPFAARGIPFKVGAELNLELGVDDQTVIG